MTFRIGQKVVCMDDSNWQDGYGDEKTPVEGEVYTVRGCETATGRDGRYTAIWLEEIVNTPRQYFPDGFCEPSFPTSRFRPLVKTSTRESRQAIIDSLKARELEETE